MSELDRDEMKQYEPVLWREVERQDHNAEQWAGIGSFIVAGRDDLPVTHDDSGDPIADDSEEFGELAGNGDDFDGAQELIDAANENDDDDGACQLCGVEGVFLVYLSDGQMWCEECCADEGH